jgi:hypothetical protein
VGPDDLWHDNDLIGAEQAIALRFGNPANRLVEEKEGLVYAFGRTMVVVYRKDSPSQDHVAFSFRVHGQKEDFLGPLHFVRIKGEWMIWRYR